MKKLICALLALTMLLALCACAKKEEPKAEEPAAEQSAEQPVGLANPLREIKAEDMAFPVNVPEGATDVQYFTITSGDEVTYECRFRYEGKEIYVRAKSTGELAPFEFAGLNTEFKEADAQVLNMTAKTYLSDKNGVIAFLDIVPGVIYNVCSKDPITAEELVKLAETCYVPTQGDAG